MLDPIRVVVLMYYVFQHTSHVFERDRFRGGSRSWTCLGGVVEPGYDTLLLWYVCFIGLFSAYPRSPPKHKHTRAHAPMLFCLPRKLEAGKGAAWGAAQIGMAGRDRSEDAKADSVDPLCALGCHAGSADLVHLVLWTKKEIGNVR